MRKFYFTFFAYLFCASLLAQKTTLETNFGASFAGYGDQHGLYGGLKPKVDLYKGFYVTAHFSMGYSSDLRVFSNQDLKTLEGLLVLDENVENFPLQYIQATLELGTKTVSPSTDFYGSTFAALGVGKHFTIGKNKRLLIDFDGGMSWHKKEVTYITLVQPGMYESIFTNGVIPVTLAVPLVISYIDYLWYVAPSVKYKINEHFSAGLFGVVYRNKRDITSCYGLSLETIIFKGKE